MALIGPNEASFYIDSYNSSANTVGNMVQLTDVTECSGIVKTSQLADVTAIGDAYRSQAPTGQAAFEDITLRGTVDVAAGVLNANSTPKRVGAAAQRADYPARTFEIRYKGNTLKESIEVIPKMRDIQTPNDGVAMFEIVLTPVAAATADHVETGF